MVGSNTVFGQPFRLDAVGETSTVGEFPGPNIGILQVSPVVAVFEWGPFSGSILGSLRWFNNCWELERHIFNPNV